MAMTFTCPACGRKLEAPDAAAGQRGVCKFCGARIVAPAAPGQAAHLEPPPTDAAPQAPQAMAWQPPPAAASPPGYAPPPTLPVADFMQRVIGFVVDVIGQWVVFLLLHPVLSLVNPWPSGDLGSLLSALSSGGGNPQDALAGLNVTNMLLNQVFWLVWFALIQWLYFALFESSSLQATPGKLLAGTKVTDMQGRRIGFGRATTRALAKGLSAMLCYIGYLMAAFNDRCQTLHDMIAQTLVLKRRP